MAAPMRTCAQVPGMYRSPASQPPIGRFRSDQRAVSKKALAGTVKGR